MERASGRWHQVRSQRLQGLARWSVTHHVQVGARLACLKPRKSSNDCVDVLYQLQTAVHEHIEMQAVDARTSKAAVGKTHDWIDDLLHTTTIDAPCVVTREFADREYFIQLPHLLDVVAPQ